MCEGECVRGASVCGRVCEYERVCMWESRSPPTYRALPLMAPATEGSLFLCARVSSSVPVRRLLWPRPGQSGTGRGGAAPAG